MMFAADPMLQWTQNQMQQSPDALSISQSHPAVLCFDELERYIGPISDCFSKKSTLDFASRQGSLLLREGLAAQYDHLEAQHLLTFCGAQEALFVSLRALLKNTDRVVAFTPIFEPMVHSVLEIGAELCLIPLLISDEIGSHKRRWIIDFDRLEQEFVKGCSVVVINFPHNPTGAHLLRAELDRLIGICRKYGVAILSDEVFRGLEYDSAQRLPVVADIYEKAISIGVFSKAYGIPALRIGWCISKNQGWLKRMAEIKAHLSICCSAFDEAIAERVVLKSQEIFTFHAQKLLRNKENLDIFMEKHQEIFDYIPAEAGACCFPVLKRAKAKDFAEQLLIQNQLKILPAHLFLAQQQGFRLSFSRSTFLEHFSKVIM